MHVKFGFIQRERYRLKVSRNKVLGITFGPKYGKVIGVWEKGTTRSFTICTTHYTS